MTENLDRPATATCPPNFDSGFRRGLVELLLWRRDVRRFRSDPVPEEVMERLLDLACLAPSVGNSQPWRFVRIDGPERRQAVKRNFERCNAAALSEQQPGRRSLYTRLKLEGLDQAPVHLAVFCDEAGGQGHGLGAVTMPEARRYSVVTAIHTFWLAARAEGLGVGWLSILDPAAMAGDLETPAGWTFVAYLCIGWPVEDHLDPELVRHQWQARSAECRKVLQR